MNADWDASRLFNNLLIAGNKSNWPILYEKTEICTEKMVTLMWWRKVVIVNYEQIKICDCPASILGSLALFQIRICDFSYPISNLNSSPGQSNNKITYPIQGPGSIQHKILLYLILKQILSVYSLYKRIPTPPPPPPKDPDPPNEISRGKKIFQKLDIVY